MDRFCAEYLVQGLHVVIEDWVDDLTTGFGKTAIKLAPKSFRSSVCNLQGSQNLSHCASSEFSIAISSTEISIFLSDSERFTTQS